MIVLLLILLLAPCLALSQALPRTRPYAETKCSTDSNVFFCEDFEGEDIVNYGNNNCASTWGNPGIQTKDICWAGGGTHQLSTIALPGFTQATNRVWRVTKTTSFTDINTSINTGTGNGTIAGWLKPSILGTGAREWYQRIQGYFSTDHLFPADLDFKMLVTLPGNFVDPPSAGWDQGIFLHQDFACQIGGVWTSFNDVPVMRTYGANPIFPYQNEYCPPLSPGTAPNGTQAPRLQKNRWYTFESHVKLATDGTGLLEFWVDGILTYQSTRQTCVSPNCADLGYIMLLGWMNQMDPQAGYFELDNVIFSRAPIGVPVTSTSVTRHVDSTTTGSCVNGGNNYNPDTEACGTGGTSTIYTTITNGINAATTVAGDILEIHAGTYAETINYQTLTYRPVGTNWTNAPTIRGKAGQTVTLRGVNIYGNAAWKYIKFENLIFDANESSAEAVNVGSGDLLTAPSYVRFTNCEAKNSNAAGGVQFARAFGCEWIGDAVSGNSAGRIRDNGNVAGQNHGIYIYGLNSIVDGAEITNNWAYGVHAHSASSSTGNNGLIVRNSHIHDNGVGGTANSPAGILVHGSSNALVYNNIIEGNPHGIALGTGFGSVDNAGIYNNSVYANTFNGIWNRDSTLNSTIQNNITYLNGTANILNTGGGTTTCTSNLGSTVIGCVTHATPTSPFTNAAADIFTLAAGSIAVGNGTPKTLIFNTDIAGTTRTIPWDIGAYKAAITSNLTLNVPDAAGISWQIGSSQAVTFTSTGNSGFVDINEDRDGNGTYEFPIVDNLIDPGGSVSYSFTVGGSAGSSRKMQVCDADGSPCDVSSNTYAVTVAAGGSGTVIISDNTSGTHIGTITGTTNALMAQDTPTILHQGTLGVRANKFNSASHTHTVLKFPTSVIPTTATITGAVLGLYRTAGTGTFSIDIRNSKRAWVQSETNWTNFATGPANVWGTAGGINNTTDRDSTVLCNMSINADTPQYYTCSSAGLTAWAQSVVNLGTPNNGLHLERNGAESTILGTFASNTGDSDKRPYLSLTYTTVAPLISVVAPTAQDAVFPDHPLGIRWGSQGISGNVTILLSRDGGLNYPELIAAQVLYNSPDYVWPLVTPGRSNNCKIKVISLDNPSVFGESAPFKIRGRRTRLVQ